MTWLAIRGLAALGLARDVHLLPKNAERFRIRREVDAAGRDRGRGLAFVDRCRPVSAGAARPARESPSRQGARA